MDSKKTNVLVTESDMFKLRTEGGIERQLRCGYECTLQIKIRALNEPRSVALSYFSMDMVFHSKADGIETTIGNKMLF